MKKHFQEMQYSFLIYIALLSVIAWALYGVFSEKPVSDPVKVSVIVSDSNNARWQTFRLGLETAAKDENVDLNYLPTSAFNKVEQEWNLVRDVKEGGDGIIISPLTSDGLDEFYDALSWEVSLGFVESDVSKGEQSDNNIVVAEPDYMSIAEALFEQIKKDLNGELPGKTVMFYATNDQQHGMITLKTCLQEKLEQAGCKYLGCDVNNEFEKSDLHTLDSIDIKIGLDDAALLTLAKSKNLTDDKSICIHGLGVSEPCIYYLDKGIIDGMIVVDDFNMGYQCLKIVAQNIRNKYSGNKNYKVNFYSVRSEDVHDPEIENILFPVVQ